jgi:glycerate kinase
VVAIPTTVLVAPDSFKGTFTAPEVTAAIARGLEAAGWPVDPCPVADGGEGTLEVLVGALGGELVAAEVHDPLGRPIDARFALSAAAGDSAGKGGGTRAVVETASASGLALVTGAERDPLAASTRGTGELILAAVEAGAEAVLLGVGGSATTDGGAGAVAAIREAGGIGRARLIVLCDVQTTFEDAARVYAPQKGADGDDVRRLARRLNDLARRLPRDPRGVAMTGAAGGLSGGLWAAFGAELVSGAAFVLESLGFDARMRAARAVVTGEGRLDRQSLAGKAVSEVATRARQAGVPCHAVVGERCLDAFGARILDLQAILEASTLAEIEAAGAELAGLL